MTRSADPSASTVPMPRRRTGHTVQFAIGAEQGYLTTGVYPDGRVGLVELRLAKQGSTLAGVTDALSCAISTGLQAGAPLQEFVDELRQTRFEPAGATDDPSVPFATSLADYVARRLLADHLQT